jgi:hypothetical protein
MPSITPFKLLFLILAATLGVYLPGLGGGFLFDDSPAIIYNADLQVRDLSLAAMWQAMWSYTTSGPLGRPIAMLSLWVNYCLSGLDSRDFRITNILIHLVNGLLLYRFCLLVLQTRRQSRDPVSRNEPVREEQAIALLAAALWLLHPLNLTSVLYVVQRMTSLSALFTLLAMIGYLRARLKMIQGQDAFISLVASVMTFGALAALSKETGLLLPLFLLVLEITLFRFYTLAARHRHQLLALFVAIVVVPGIIAIPYLLERISPASFVRRDFSLLERLMTESRVLWTYVKLMFLPRLNELGLYHDDIAISRSITDPRTTIVACAGIVAAVAIALRSLRRSPMLAFAIAWFLTGHLMESTVISLELMHEHRNYLPLAGVTFAIAYGLHNLYRAGPKRVAAALAGLCIAGLAVTTALRAHAWRDPVTLAVSEAKHHPRSARANLGAGLELAKLAAVTDEGSPERPQAAEVFGYMEEAARLNPQSIYPFPALLAAADVFGHPKSGLWLEELKLRLRTQTRSPVIPLSGMIRREIEIDSLRREQVVEIVSAALDNPRLSAVDRGRLLGLLSYYFAAKHHDYQQAVRLAIAATEQAPKAADLRIMLAGLAITLGNPEVAREQIEILESLDRHGVNTHRVRQLRAAIDAMSARPEPSR